MTQNQFPVRFALSHDPSRLRWAIAVTVGGWMACAGVHAADIGTAFTYQGFLEKAGAPVSATCQLRSWLHDAAIGGNVRGNSPQIASNVPVEAGGFTAVMDFGVDSLDGTARWLAIEVQCPGDADYVMLSPRVELTPAPHSVRAVEAAALDLPYAATEATAAPMLELIQTGDGPAAIFKVQPQPEPPIPAPAVEAISETSAAAIKATNSGLGPAAVLEKVGAIDPEYHPTLEVRNDVGGPAARLVASPTTPGIPALEVRNEGEGPGVTITVAKELGPDPALKATNTGLGPTAVLEKVGMIDPELHPTLEVRNEVGGPAAELVSQGVGTTPDLPTLKVTNSGLGLAIEAVSGHVGPPELPTIKATNVGVGTGLEVSSGELSVSSAPTLRATNIGIGTAAYVSATNGTAIQAVSAGGGLAGYFEGGVTSTGNVACATLAWGTSALGDDQGGVIELGNSLTTGNSPYIDFHRGVGLAQDYNIRLINDAAGRLSVNGDVRVTGTLEVQQPLTLSGNLSIDSGDLTVSSGDLEVSTGDLRVGSNITLASSGNVTVSTGELSVSSSGPAATMSATNSNPVGLAGSFTGSVHVTGNLTKAYTSGTSNSAAPLAYATVDGTTGLVIAGTPNVSSVWESGNQRFVITIAGENYSTSTHITTVTPFVGASPEALFATTSSSTPAGTLRIRIMSSSTGTTGLQRSFQFIVYKP